MWILWLCILTTAHPIVTQRVSGQCHTHDVYTSLYTFFVNETSITLLNYTSHLNLRHKRVKGSPSG